MSKVEFDACEVCDQPLGVDRWTLTLSNGLKFDFCSEKCKQEWTEDDLRADTICAVCDDSLPHCCFIECSACGINICEGCEERAYLRIPGVKDNAVICPKCHHYATLYRGLEDNGAYSAIDLKRGEQRP